jgi:recombination protein RecR
MDIPEINQLVQLLGKLPGLGPRSGRRAALHLIKKKSALMSPLITALEKAHQVIQTCHTCGNLDTKDTCNICLDPKRDRTILCIVEDVGDLWAMERSGAYKGLYHILGGTLSALDGIGPEDLNIPKLLQRLEQGQTTEVLLALNATLEGQTTAHYLAERIKAYKIKTTRLAYGVPIGGEIDYLDDGTISAALSARQQF